MDRQLAEDTKRTAEGIVETEDGAYSNMPCDNTGYCAGTACPMFFICNS